MGTLCDFHFYSFSEIDNHKEKIEFNAKGYKREDDNSLIYYFKHDNSYKFIIKKDILSVEVNESKYVFDSSKETNGYINVGNYSISAKIITNELNISTNKIEIIYEMCFDSFKGKYHIILELY